MTYKDNRLSELDALRGIAAMCVVFFHFTTKFREFYGYHFSSKYDFNLGQYGVALFFVISGFVIFMTLQKIKSLGDFAFKRFSRLYPSYWICIIITFSAITLFGLPGKEVTIKQALVNFTMLQELFNVKNVDGAYWSLLPEILFYFLMGLIFQFKLLKRIKLLGFIWLLLIIVNKFHHIPVLNTFINLQYGMLFFAGILFYSLKFIDRSSIITHLLILCCGITAVIVNYSIVYALVIIIIFGIFYLFTYEKLFFIGIKPLLFLGYISYPLYLIHQYIGYIIILRLKNFNVNEFVAIFIAISFAILMAWFITACLEKPIHKYLRKIGDSKQHIIVTTNN